MKRLIVLILLTFALVGCTQPEGRYGIIRQAEETAWLIDRQTGCVWVFFADADKKLLGFFPVPVKGLHEGQVGKKVEGCSREG